jgi:hypothetical protein
MSSVGDYGIMAGSREPERVVVRRRRRVKIVGIMER